jgi:flagellar biogenesis protein FliO
LTTRVQVWFGRQSSTVKLLLAVPLLLAAVLWSAWPGSGSSTADPGNRPVLARETSPAGIALATPPSGQIRSLAANAAGTPASAAAPILAPHQEPRPVDGGLSWGTALRTLFSVAVVVILIVLCGRLLRHFMANAVQPAASGAHIRVVETAYIPAPSGRGRAAVHLLEVGDRLLLVGATDAQLTLLGEFDEADSAQRAKLLLPPEMAAASTASTASAASPAASSAAAQETAPASGAAAVPVRSAAHFAELLVDAGAKFDAGSAIGNDGAGRMNGTNGRNGTNGTSTTTPSRADDISFGEHELAAMLARLRDSKRRLESGS